jgi:hypothetical protein
MKRIGSIPILGSALIALLWAIANIQVSGSDRPS